MVQSKIFGPPRWSRCQQYITLWCMIVANRPSTCHFFHVTSLLLVLFYPCLSTFDCSAPKVDGSTYIALCFLQRDSRHYPFWESLQLWSSLGFLSQFDPFYPSKMLRFPAIHGSTHAESPSWYKKPQTTTTLINFATEVMVDLPVKSWLLLVFVMFFNRFNRPISTTFWPHVSDVSATDSSPRLGLNTPNLAELGDRWAGRGSWEMRDANCRGVDP